MMRKEEKKEDTGYGKSAYDMIEVDSFIMYGIGNMIVIFFFL